MSKYLLYFLSIPLIISLTSLSACSKKTDASPEQPDEYDTPTSFSGDSAYTYVKKQVDFGPRVPGSKAHSACGDWLVAKLKSFGANVTEQTTSIKTYDGKTYKCRNIIASYSPEKTERVLLLSHWDCRPFSDNDEDESKWHTPVDGANDGASGVGVLMEIARQLSMSPASVGVDILFTDIEDYGIPQFERQPSDESTWCLGTQYWAEQAKRDGYKARFGILLDMVGSPTATFPKESYSLQYASGVVDKIWTKARRLGYSELFQNRQLGSITDDHVPVNESAGIPTADIIHFNENGFGYYWHTTNDNMTNVSISTLQAVGEVVLGVVRDEK